MRRDGRAFAALAAVAFLALASVGRAQAEADDQALAPFAKPAAATAAAARNGPPDPLDWERRWRGPDRLGPTPLREADAALLAAASAGRWAQALTLIQSGQASPQARDDRGTSALALAAAAGQDALVRELLKRGADIDRPGAAGFTPLGAAAFQGQRSTVRLLLRAGADPARWGSSGQTALHLAAVAGQVDIVEEFLRARVDLELLNRARESALDTAANAGQLDVMDRLLKAGADSQRAGQR